MRFKPLTQTAIALAALVALPTGAAVAADDKPAEEWIHDRQATLAIAGAATKSAACAVKGEGCPRKFDYLALQARAIAHAAKLAPDAFREGPFPDADAKTTALPKIWDNYDKFAGGFDKMRENAMAMVDAAKNKDLEAYAAALKKTADTCESCHDNFREEH